MAEQGLDGILRPPLVRRLAVVAAENRPEVIQGVRQPIRIGVSTGPFELLRLPNGLVTVTIGLRHLGPIDGLLHVPQIAGVHLRGTQHGQEEKRGHPPKHTRKIDTRRRTGKRTLPTSTFSALAQQSPT